MTPLLHLDCSLEQGNVCALALPVIDRIIYEESKCRKGVKRIILFVKVFQDPQAMVGEACSHKGFRSDRGLIFLSRLRMASSKNCRKTRYYNKPMQA